MGTAEIPRFYRGNGNKVHGNRAVLGTTITGIPRGNLESTFHNLLHKAKHGALIGILTTMFAYVVRKLFPSVDFYSQF